MNSVEKPSDTCIRSAAICNLRESGKEMSGKVVSAKWLRLAISVLALAFFSKLATAAAFQPMILISVIMMSFTTFTHACGSDDMIAFALRATLIGQASASLLRSLTAPVSNLSSQLAVRSGNPCFACAIFALGICVGLSTLCFRHTVISCYSLGLSSTAVLICFMRCASSNAYSAEALLDVQADAILVVSTINVGYLSGLLGSRAVLRAGRPYDKVSDELEERPKDTQHVPRFPMDEDVAQTPATSALLAAASR